MKLNHHIMKPIAHLFCLFLLVATGLTSTKAATTPAGYWEGSITLPAVELEIHVELKSGEPWEGTIDIPVQGIRGFQLTDISVANRMVSFRMPGIPGDPEFAGRLSQDEQTISGDFTQGGQTFPFRLEHRSVRPERAGETPANGIPGKGLAGDWQGSLRPTPVIEMRLVLKIEPDDDGGLGGQVISVDQGATRMPITNLSQDDRQVRLKVSSVGGSFDGTLSPDGSEIEGEWKQGGRSFPLVFKRLASAPDFSRPQEPVKPYPYDEEEVVIDNQEAELRLAGTLTTPRGGGPHPAVVLITGSGPQDRDEAIMGHRPFLVLADHLTRQGIAVLRYDDRGVGKSTGKFSEALHEDFVMDALSAVEWLKKRPDIDPLRIGLVGHSEGGVVAPLAAVAQPDDIAFIVLLAGVGVPMEELLVRQGQDLAGVMGADVDTLARSQATQRETFRLLKTSAVREELEPRLRELFKRELSKLTEEQLEAAGYTEAMIEGQLKTVLTPWFRNLLVYDPRPTLRRVTCPVLAINGEKDLQVAPEENLAAIREALSEGGNSKVQTVELPGLNHLFQKCKTGALAEYAQIEETFNPEALTLVSNWLREQAGLTR